MNAVTTVEEKPRQKPAVQSGGRIAPMIPTDIDQAYRMAQALAGSHMTPKAFNNDPNKILVGIIAGMEVGLAPFQALQSIAVINGNPSLWGDGALALIQGSGLLVDIEETDDGETATCRLVRKDRETPIVRSFSNAMAKAAGLLGKAGPWTQYQSRMRQMRARSWAMRDGFPDVLKGIGIAEEVRDFPPEAYNDAAPPPPRLTRAALADHAVEQQEEIIDAETVEVEQESPQSPTPETSPPVEGADAVSGRGEDAEKLIGAASSPFWSSLIEGAIAAQSADDVEALQTIFDERESEVPLDRLAEVHAAIEAAMGRFG